MAGGAPGRVAAKNVRDSDSDQTADVASDGGLGGIVVSTQDMSETEKDFLLNESIAFEEQEAAVKDIAVAAPVEETVTEDITPEAGNSAIDEEEAVAALNASAAQAAAERTGITVPNDQTLSETLAEDIEVSSSSAIVNIDADEPVAFEPPAAEPETVLMPEIEEEIIVLEMDAVEAVPVEADTIETSPSLPIMPKSDVAAAESLLAEPENPIEMPKVKTTTHTMHAKADFRQPDIENADQAALARIVALEKELEKTRVENEALNDELENSLKEGEREQLVVSSENWNLERATMRYNEAERQMKKLGQQLQKERAQHAMEKKELETMLFDPEVTSQEQLGRLSKLEQELAAAKAELEKVRAGMGQ